MDVILSKSTRVRFFQKLKLRFTKISLISMIVGALLGLSFYLLLNYSTNTSTVMLNPFFTCIYGFILGALLSVKKK